MINYPTGAAAGFIIHKWCSTFAFCNNLKKHNWLTCDLESQISTQCENVLLKDMPQIVRMNSFVVDETFTKQLPNSSSNWLWQMFFSKVFIRKVRTDMKRTVKYLFHFWNQHTKTILKSQKILFNFVRCNLIRLSLNNLCFNMKTF